VDEDACVAPLVPTCETACDPGARDCLAPDRTRLDGSDGFLTFDLLGATDVPAAGVAWSVVSAPFGAVQQPYPADTALSTFTPLVAGTYTLRMVAWDELNQAVACEMALVAEPVEGIHVLLTWTTGDPGDQSSDVDLHLLHPDALGWFDDALDCYYNSCTDFGYVDTGTDSDGGYSLASEWANLDIDDTSGWGPENMRVLEPEDGAYTVGVHYYHDGEIGPADVSVVVYCGGVEQGRFFLDDLTNEPGAYGDCEAGTAFVVLGDVIRDNAAGTCTLVPRTECLGRADAACLDRYGTCPAD
jgi:hypothetical protein